jgi:tripeptide aminopeptidase
VIVTGPAHDTGHGRVGDTFARLCEIESPSGNEGAMAAAVRAELEGMGLAVVEDETGAETGAGCGNLLARVPGAPGSPTMLLCAHMDTVPLTDRVEVELVDGVYRNRHRAILGADDKVGVAVMLEAARRWVTSGAPCGCELLFTTGEEAGLLGAFAFDVEALQSEFGFVLDHAAPLGRMVVAGPTYYSVHAEFIGRAAHAGIRPEEGHSAIAAAAKAIEATRLGRLDHETTVNVGVIQGGTSPTIVPERCVIEAEVRSLDDRKASDTARGLVDTITWAASATETDVDTTIEQHLRSYRIPDSDPAATVASAALQDCGLEPVAIASGGGSDASAFAGKGLNCVNLAVGVEANHTPDERVSAWALDKVLDVALRLVVHAARA